MANLFITKIYSKYKESGLLGLIIIFIKRLGFFDYFYFFYFYRSALNTINMRRDIPSNVDVKIFSSIDKVGELTRVFDKTDIFRKRFKKGFFSVVIYFEDVPVGYVWGQVGPGQHKEEQYGFVIDIEADEVYDFDSYIDPQYRGFGLMNYLTQGLVEHAEKEYSKSAVTAIVERINLKSVRIHEKLGFKRINLQVAFKIFSLSGKLIIKNCS